MRTKDDPVVVAFTAALLAGREAAGLTPDELARRAGISQATLYRLEHGQSGPSLPTAVRLAAALSLPLAGMVSA